MQNTKLTLTLTQADELAPTPDGEEGANTEQTTGGTITPDTGTFTGTTNNTSAISSIALVFSAVLLTIVAAVIIVRKLKKTGRLGTIVPVFLVGIIFAGAAGTLVNRSFADTNDTDNDADYADISVPETIKLTGELDKEGNTFSSAKATINLNEIANYGYKLFLYANADSLVPVTEGNETNISSVEEDDVALSTNTYGYTLTKDAKPEDEVWRPLSTISSLTEGFPSTQTDVEIYFGILTDKDATPDTYELTTTSVVIKNLPMIHNLTYLQDFTKLSTREKNNVIMTMHVRTANSDEGSFQYVLKDKRDGKEYHIGRMSNNRLFMLDNLALSATNSDSTARVLTSDDSDVTADFTMPTEAWGSYYCKASMDGDETSGFKYNWYAAMANPNTECTGAADANTENDAKSLGSICPAGWTLPNYSTDITREILVSGGSNPGSLESAAIWSSERVSDYEVWQISLNYRMENEKSSKGGVRCILR